MESGRSYDYLESGIRSARESAGGERAGNGDERILRAKYLDWCSARIAERFLQLTPDEIYELAHRASSEKDASSRDAHSASGSEASNDVPALQDLEPIASFRRIVERVTEVLASTVPLPSFEDWSQSYRRSPARYDEELLGFWREMI